MKWSFDDNHIGLMPERGSALATREVARPVGLSLQAWHQFAVKVIRLLNIEKNRLDQHVAKESK